MWVPCSVLVKSEELDVIERYQEYQFCDLQAKSSVEGCSACVLLGLIIKEHTMNTAMYWYSVVRKDTACQAEHVVSVVGLGRCNL